MHDWLNRVGLIYHSPHKFRHGFAVYGLKMAKDIAELKTISQNLMHSSISITDGIYGILSKNDVIMQLNQISNRINNINTQNKDEIITLLMKILNKIEK